MMTTASNNSPIGLAAAILATRRQQGEQGSRLPEDCRPLDIDTALAIQAAVGEQLGDRIAGWKCALPAEDRIVVAPIYGNTVHTSSPCPATTRDARVRIEPELAFILGKDLPARATLYSPAEVDAAIVRTHLALELIDSRYSDQAAVSFAEHLADGLLNQGLFIGPHVDDAAARKTATMAIHIHPEAGEDTRLDGRHPNTDPRAPLYWLAEFLRARGQGLQAGQAIITGSYAGSFDVPVDQVIMIRYGELGELTVRFTQR